MKLMDSVLKEKIELDQDNVNIYLCGPTVYDDAHLGHARSSVCLICCVGFYFLWAIGCNLLEIIQI